MDSKTRKAMVIVTILFVILAIMSVIAVLSVAGVIKIPWLRRTINNVRIGKIDDWEFEGIQHVDYDKSYASGELSTIGASASSFEVMDASNSTIGFSTGGAKDINSFRENINNGYFPISTDITYNGLFYDYVFDTGNKTESNELFSPSYSKAISSDPISNLKEYYLTVGLNSNIKQSDFQRKKLNLVVVLDISGSMGSSFNSYYYDNPLKINEEDSEDKNKSKMEIANESVNILIDQLHEDDRFGMVLFDDEAYLGKPIRLVENTDMEAIKKHILEIEDHGGTNFEAGYTMATDLYKDYLNANSDEYENRIIIITDAMPNYGETSKTGLLSMVDSNAEKGIYTTFIGVGVDFNTELIEEISDVRGANYYSVNSSKEFKERMGEQFEYMVTPLVFDLELNLNSSDYEIAAVYGSDTVNKDNGNIMKVNTLFPSKTTSTGEVKGGVVLLKLNKLNENAKGEINLSVSYKDRNMQSYSNSQIVEFEDGEDMYENTGIRKAIVLTRYVNTLKNWILYERSENTRFVILPTIGIIDCEYTEDEIKIILGENERTSVKLTVSDIYKDVFTKIKNYIILENVVLKDETFNNEIKILDKLIAYKGVENVRPIYEL